MTLEEQVAKQWEEATIQDNFIFSKTMELYPDICKKLIELILKIKVKSLHYPEREKSIETRLDSKGVRLDVYVEDEENRSFDIEMQIADSDNISKRMRYYQSLIDGDKLKRGEHYSVLGESYIIFICPFDKFKCGRHIYKFRERCDEDYKLTLDDGAFKIFLNTKGTLDDVDAELKSFLDYVDKGIISGEIAKEVDNAVSEVKINKRARLSYMTFEMYMREMKMDARKEGRLEERFQMVKNLILASTPIEYIKTATGWSEEKILQFEKELKNPAE